MHLDEHELAKLAAREGVRFVPPYNIGVCVMNNGIWRAIARVQEKYLTFVWRFLLGLSTSDNGVHLNPAIREQVARVAGRHDFGEALPYPSSSWWIVDQIAMWLTLGAIPDFSHGLLSHYDVIQGGEFLTLSRPPIGAILFHYFTNNEREFVAWLSYGGHRDPD
jgi:hypothetical protein